MASETPSLKTTIVTGASAAITVSLYTKPPYDITKDLMPVGYAASTPYVVVAHPSLNVSTMQELVATAKARPGRINYASSGSGSAGWSNGARSKRTRSSLSAFRNSTSAARSKKSRR
mgnify:CR=1 FL=1